jgi:uncharacterized delta-60 repeat protein
MTRSSTLHRHRRRFACQPQADMLETRELLSTAKIGLSSLLPAHSGHGSSGLVVHAAVEHQPAKPARAHTTPASAHPTGVAAHPARAVTSPSRTPGVVKMAVAGTPWVNVTDASQAGFNDRGNVVAIDSQNRPISIGTYSTASSDTTDTYRFDAVRYNTDATLDTSFHGNGIAPVSNTGRGYAGLLQPDQKVVIGGMSAAGYMTLARINPDGSADTSFGSKGVVTSQIGQNEPGVGASAIEDVALDAQSRIVAVGDIGAYQNGAWKRDVVVARYTATGSLDKTFNKTGYTTLDFKNQSAIAYTVLVLPGGQILVGGMSYTYGSTGTDTAFLARYNSSGSLDTSFGTGGMIVGHLPGSVDDAVYDLALDSSGQIVVAAGVGTTTGPLASQAQPMVLRYNANGALDTTFNGTGFITLPTPARYIARSLALYSAADGTQKIVVGLGTSWWTATDDFGLAQLNANGTLDPSFGGTGVVFQDLNSGQVDKLGGIAIAQLPDGPRIYATGSIQKASIDTITVRFRVDGTLDTV